MTDELAAWIRRQMAFDETQLRGVIYTSRSLDVAPPLETLEMLGQIEADRRRLDTLGDLELRELGLLYADREGYRQEWRP